MVALAQIHALVLFLAAAKASFLLTPASQPQTYCLTPGGGGVGVGGKLCAVAPISSYCFCHPYFAVAAQQPNFVPSQQRHGAPQQQCNCRHIVPCLVNLTPCMTSTTEKTTKIPEPPTTTTPQPPMRTDEPPPSGGGDADTPAPPAATTPRADPPAPLMYPPEIYTDGYSFYPAFLQQGDLPDEVGVIPARLWPPFCRFPWNRFHPFCRRRRLRPRPRRHFSQSLDSPACHLVTRSGCT